MRKIKLQESNFQIFPTPPANSFYFGLNGGTLSFKKDNGLTNDQILGPSGFQGPVGSVGNSGSSGATGSQGTSGSVGPVGITGPQGQLGASGNQGPSGLTGPEGNIGPVGAQGPQSNGAPGATGPTGSQGPTGSVDFLIYTAILSYNSNTGFTVSQLFNTIGDGSSDGTNDISWATQSGFFTDDGNIYGIFGSGSIFTDNVIVTANSIKDANNVAYSISGESNYNLFPIKSLRLTVRRHDNSPIVPNFDNLFVEIRKYD